MNEDETRQRLVDAVPASPEAPERPPGRATARRRRQVGSVVLVAVAGVAVAGALLSVPARNGRPADTVAHPQGLTVSWDGPLSAPTAQPSLGLAASSFPNPVVSQAYVTVSPGPDANGGPDGVPPRDAPLPSPGTCPESVDPMRLPIHNPWDASTWPRRVTEVTLCRYEHSSADTSEGHNRLTRGPVVGDLAVFTAALRKALPPVRPIDHMGCRIVNQGPPYTIDVVFVTASGGTGKAYLMLRMLCDPVWPQNPERTLTEAVDAVLGPPY